MENNKNTDTFSVDKNERVVISNGISQVHSRKVPPSVTKQAPRKCMNIAEIYEEDPPRTDLQP